MNPEGVLASIDFNFALVCVLGIVATVALFLFSVLALVLTRRFEVVIVVVSLLSRVLALFFGKSQ